MVYRSTVARFLAAAAIAFLLSAGVSLSQGTPGFHIGVSGGAVFPIENQSDVFNTGWNAALVIPINFGDSPFGIRLDGSYGELQTKDSLAAFTGNGKSRIISGAFDLVIGPHLGAVQPYVIGGVGAYDLRFSGQEVDGGNLFAESSTRFGWNAGVGVAFRMGQSSTQIFVEGRYTSISLNGDRFTDSIHTGGTRFTLIPVNLGVIF
jgi:opacity protein-like surface antigen